MGTRAQPPAERDSRHTTAVQPPAPSCQDLPWSASASQANQSGAQRSRLKKRVFRGCDKDGDGYLDKEEMLSLAVLTGFEGSDDSWAEEYARLCRECNADRNI